MRDSGWFMTYDQILIQKLMYINLDKQRKE